MQYTRSFYLLACGIAVGLILATLQFDRNATLLLMSAGFSLLVAMFGYARSPGPVNVWDAQRRLMRISGQSLPELPTLTSDGVLYVGLTVEELAEVLEAQVRAILTHSISFPRGSCERSELTVRANTLDRLQKTLLHTSKALRAECVLLKEAGLSVPLDLDTATDLFDGVTDVMVTTSALPEAHGLPGEDGYFIVQQSNHSKANPATGLIEKTPDGKWIKDPAWWPAEPRLRALLAERFYDEDELENCCGN